VILADTSVIIDFWKNPGEEKKAIFLQDQVAICGIITAELMHGAKNEADLERIAKALADFAYLPVEEELWIQVGGILYRLKRNGVSAPFQDVVITSLCLQHGCRLWTLDKHFESIRSVEKELQLLNP
jgi:predicted nucleic acid-binding protein